MLRSASLGTTRKPAKRWMPSKRLLASTNFIETVAIRVGEEGADPTEFTAHKPALLASSYYTENALKEG